MAHGNVQKTGRCLTALLLLLFLAGHAYAQDIDFNPKSVESITMRITQSGSLAIAGSVQRANLTLYVPQEGVLDTKVASNAQMSWQYSSDIFGNKVVSIEWTKPSGTVTYSVETTVKSTAKFVNPTSDIGYDVRFLNATKSIVINDDIRRIAYPYDRTWENVAYLSQYVYDIVEYDIRTVGQRKPSDWVLENKKGVCVEHANLLASLLRASGIPTRYVVGYAYSVVDKKLIGHTWVEVLASDGRWVPFDPTWLQGGFLDATHIKTASLLDDTQIDILTYVGTGGITWRRGSSVGGSPTGDLYADKVEILDYRLTNITSIILSPQDVPLGGYGYVKASVRPDACLINDINVQSCVNADGNEVLDIYEKERKFFSCSPKEVYWFFRETDGKNRYTCPVTVYDQIGSSENADVDALARRSVPSPTITGPNIVSVNERFTLYGAVSNDFVFYSPEFGRSLDDEWSMQIKRTGIYTFYLYEDGGLARKTVQVVEKKEFDLGVAVPQKVMSGQNFTVNVTATNIGSGKEAVLGIEFGGRRIEKSLVFSPSEVKEIRETFAANTPGQKKISVTLQADTLTPYSGTIIVEGEKKGSFVDAIVNPILGFFAGIRDFFNNLFGKG